MARKKKKGVPGVAEVTDPHEDVFLRAIMEDLADDTLRLVYADWLEEKGEPRGEFIRCQVFAAWEETPPARKLELTARADELMARHEWLPPLFRTEDTVIERGFLAGFRLAEFEDDTEDDVILRLDADLAPHAADPFFALTPAFVDDDYEYNPMLSVPVRVPRLGALGKIDWSGCTLGGLLQNDADEPPSPLAALFTSSPHLAGLRELRLGQCGLFDDAVVALATNPAAASLRALDLSGGGDGSVSGNFFGDEGLAALAGSPYLGGLEELDLNYCWLSDEGVERLCESPRLPRLRKLDLDGVPLTNRGYQALARSSFTARLVELKVGRNYYQRDDAPDGVGARALAESPHLEHVKKISIRLRGLPGDVRSALRARFGDRVELPDD